METLSVFFTSLEWQFLFNIIFCLLIGTAMGLERQIKGKDAGIRTFCFVILGAMVFTFISHQVDAQSTSRIAAQIVTWIGFLGAWLIIKDSESSQIKNLTTAATIWYAGAIGMLIGFNFYVLAAISALGALAVPHFSRVISRQFDPTKKYGTPHEEEDTEPNHNH